MSTYLSVLLGICYALLTGGLLVASLALWDDGQKVHCTLAAIAGVLLLAGGITFLVNHMDSESGRCGAGTTRVVYRHGKSSDAVCEVTAR